MKSQSKTIETKGLKENFTICIFVLDTLVLLREKGKKREKWPQKAAHTKILDYIIISQFIEHTCRVPIHLQINIL